ncbi:choloylglycine hydrolase [Rhodoblastus acidophilus]|uniref:linear amide C-N hydrolase n=1 Tax=Rhodoblastus acidophilus TaxID=1074 RepID=UPI0022240392|nr:linear amide C-N hydrolase [Rhodoblastus acidophilus]MCW2283054.1 choloylglycine hydrolase [Rhodoblastus acidophilus]MCW2331895.1 choloylglycine hydrolase [Rhodoblastus acidophilus]
MASDFLLLGLACAAVLAFGLLSPTPARACTRVVYHGLNEGVITARSMDWKTDIGTNLWIFPRGMTRSGEVCPNAASWTSKYGSVIASAYDVSTTDGVNEAGLVANMLWLVESDYPKYDGKTPGLSISAWAQYVLDSFASVNEAVAALEKEPFTLATDKVPGMDRLATLHLSLSDASGDSAILEYIGGKLVIHHSRAYQVMTNSPIFERQLALDAYWKEIGGAVMLPGTTRAADRFARASYYINAIEKQANPDKAVAAVFSVIRNASAPYGLTSPNPGEPNISSTRWRTVADHKRKLYYFESAMAPNTFWVDLAAIDFAKTEVMKLDLGPDATRIYSGKANDAFKPAAPFKFAGTCPDAASSPQ